MAFTIQLAAQGDETILAPLNEVVQGQHHAAHPWLFKPQAEPSVLRALFAALIADPGAIILLAMGDEAALGYLYAERRERSETAFTFANRSLYIHHLAVAPAYQRKGVARALMAKLDEIATQDGYQGVEVDFWTFNTEARTFYEACGFSAYNERWWKRG